MVLFPTSAAEASSVMRTGEAVSITADQEVEGDFYGLANTVAISGTVSEDLLVMGSTITLNGNVAADVAAAGGRVDVHGTIKDDVRIIGGQVTIAGEIGGNLVVIASELKVLSTAKIAGDVMFFGSSAEISGFVGKDILGTSEILRVDGEVMGGLDVKTDKLVLGERANITKNVVYSSVADLTRAQNSEVGGEVVRNSVKVTSVNPIKAFLIPFFITLFATLVWFLLFRRFTERVVSEVHARPVRTVLLGFGVFFLGPISAVILLASTLGVILGLTLTLFYFAILLVAMSLVGVVTGSYIHKIVSKKTTVTALYSIIGLLLVHLSLYIPIVGPMIFAGLLLLTLGSICERFYTLLRSS